MNHQEETASLEAECHAALPAVPDSPTLTALRRAYCDRLANFVTLASRVGGLREFVPLATELTQLGVEVKAISGWVLAPLSTIQWKNQLMKAAERLTGMGWTFSDAQTFVKETNEARRGHPVTKTRALAIRANDLRQKIPPVSWTTIANKICDCGEKEHTHKCRERIRIATRELEKLLDTCGIAV
jgi:hypothetical protein